MAVVTQRLAENFPEDCQKTQLPVIVKNTFIDMDDDDFEIDPRRCTSEPPQSRKREKPRVPVSLGMTEVISDCSGSTTSGSPRDSSESDTASEGRPRSQSSLSAGLNPNAPAWSPPQPMNTFSSSPTIPVPHLRGSPIFQMPAGPPTQSFEEPTPIVPPPPQYPQHRFNANAKPWQPTPVFTAPAPYGKGGAGCDTNQGASSVMMGFCYNKESAMPCEWQQTQQSWTQ